MKKTIRVLAFAGSLREDSFNKTMIRTAKQLAPDCMEIEIYDLKGIPLLNEDVERKGDPGEVSLFKKAVRAADGVLISTPEYNLGPSGAAKNAIDWLSRPLGEGPINNKPVALMGATPGPTGTAYANKKLRSSLEVLDAHVMEGAEVLVTEAHQKINNHTLIDEKIKNEIKKLLEEFYDWVLRFAGGNTPIES